MSRKSSNVGAAMLQPGRQSQAAGNISVMPAAEMPMVLTLDQLSPNPDNPRTSRNPRYDDIKASIRSRGLDTVPKVTRDPDGEPDMYIFSDGGNTRYQILSELWQETGEDRFFRVHVLFKPWPGRLQCVIGHLAENEVRGELSFIEKAQGIHKARSIYEEQMGKTVSLRQLSELLTHEGLPVHYSTVSRMEDALKYLYPWIPDLLESGLGRPQTGEMCSEAAAFLLGLTGEAPALHPAAGVCGLPELFTGGPGEGEAPALTDEDALKLLRLLRVMRRLRELQRGLTYGEDNSDE